MLWPRTGVDDDVLCCFNVDWAYVPAARSGPKGYVHMVCTKLSYKYCIAVLDLNVCSSTRIFVRLYKNSARRIQGATQPHRRRAEGFTTQQKRPLLVLEESNLAMIYLIFIQ